VTSDELQRLMEALDDLADFCEGNDPATFAQDRDPRSGARGDRRLERCERAVRGLLEQAQSRSRRSGPLTRAARSGGGSFVGGPTGLGTLGNARVARNAYRVATRPLLRELAGALRQQRHSLR